MKHALIIGEDGTIGRALAGRLRAQGIAVTGTTRKMLDLANPAGWPVLPEADVAYICAAISKLEACEKDPAGSYKVNVEGTTALAKQLLAQNTPSVFLSSNHVFDGTQPQRKPDDATCPLNEYGRQKAATEQNILAAGGAVLRLTKVIARHDARIMAWRNALAQEKPVTAFEDIFLSPVTLDNVLAALPAIGEAKRNALYQISGPNDFSYFDVACEVARQLHKDPALVHSGSGAAAGVPASFRPRYSSYVQTLPEPIEVPGIAEIVSYAIKS